MEQESSISRSGYDKVARNQEHYERNAELFAVLDQARVLADNIAENPDYIETPEDQSVLHAGKQAREQLVVENLGLVGQSVNKLPPSIREGVEEDLFQVGIIGLMEAIDGFDISFGYTLRTYAKPKIEFEIRTAVDRDYRPIKLPQDIQRDIRSIHKVFGELEQYKGRAPTIEELAIATGFNEEKITELERLKKQFRVLSLDRPVRPDSTLTLGERLPETNHDYKRQRVNELINQALDQLSERDREIVAFRLELGDEEATDLRTLGERFGLSHEAIRKIQNKGLEIVREHLSTEFDFVAAVTRGKNTIRAKARSHRRSDQKPIDIERPDFEECLQSLSPGLRALVPKFFDTTTGEPLKSPSELADDLGLRPSTVRTHLHTIRKHFNTVE